MEDTDIFEANKPGFASWAPSEGGAAIVYKNSLKNV